MAVQLTHKNFQFGSICFHHLVFKSINVAELSELNDYVSELIYENQIGLTELVIYGNLKWLKNFKKSEKQTFGETNWPLRWINAELGDESLSGYFTGVSGATVKTIKADTFINKIIDTQDYRFFVIGELFSNKTNATIEKQYALTNDELNKALLYAGCEQKNITRSWFGFDQYYDLKNDLPTGINNSYIANNQHASKILVNYQGFVPYTDRIKIEEHLNDYLLITTQKDTMLQLSSDKMTTTKNIIGELLIESTLQYFTTLLEQNNFEWSQLVRGIAYFKDIKDAKLFKTLCKSHKVPQSAIILISTGLSNSKPFVFEADFVK